MQYKLPNIDSKTAEYLVEKQKNEWYPLVIKMKINPINKNFEIDKIQICTDFQNYILPLNE
jgi:hypothetical protein